MSKTVVNFIIFSVGVAAGYGLGCVMTKNKLGNEYSKQLNEAREHYKSKYESEFQAKLNENWKEMANLAEKEEKKEAKTPERTAKIPNVEVNYDEIVKKTDYSKYSDDNKVENPVVKDGPRIIDEITYEDLSGYDRYELSYFVNDEVFMDTREVVWNNGFDKIGRENIETLVENEEDLAYIVNDDYGELYQVTIEYMAYSDFMAESDL